MANSRGVLGIDIGGTGIKIGITDVDSGKLLTERYKYLTPKPATPRAVVDVIKTAIEEHFKDYSGPIGCGFPAIIKKGIAFSATNVDKEWYTLNLEDFFSEELGTEVYVANDADVAGIAEINFGTNRIDPRGVTIFLTVGTGIGSALFYGGVMVPNTEFGHLLFQEDIYERHISNVARKREDLSWEEWGQRFNEYLIHLDRLFSPDMVIIGGGISKSFDLFSDQIEVNFSVVPASLENEAGVVGASMYAHGRAAG